jgi:hypothetical protein
MYSGSQPSSAFVKAVKATALERAMAVHTGRKNDLERAARQ